MKDDKCTFAIILSGIAIFLSIVAIYTSRPYNWELNFVGVGVTVLSVLVTLLVGWNIYSTLDIKKDSQRLRRDFENRVAENDKSVNDVKAMVFSVCADLLKKEYNNPVQAYEYYMYALRNYLFGKHRKSSIDKTLSKMEDALLRDNKATSFDSDEMFYAILNEIKTSDQLSNEQQVILERLESIRKTGNNTEDN